MSNFESNSNNILDIENFKSSLLKAVCSTFSGAIAGFAAIYLHRIGLNFIIPYGFLISVLLLFACGVIVRAYFGKIYVYLFAIVCSFAIYLLSTVTGGDVLVLATAFKGESFLANYVGWILIFGSFLFPFCAVILSEKYFAKVLKAPIWRTNDSDIDFMLSIVNETDRILEKAFLCNEYTVKLKDDGSPVTNIDFEVEKIIRKMIAKEFPNDVILGEEMLDQVVDLKTTKQSSSQVLDSKRRWIIDPIDGTKNFVRGVPIFATLIALEVECADGGRRPVKSVVSAPLLKRRWWGRVAYTANQRAVHNTTFTTRKNPNTKMTFTPLSMRQYDNYPPQKNVVSDVTNLSDCNLSISSRGGWINKNIDWFDNLNKNVKRVRGFGDFYSYMLLAQGAVDIACEPDLELYDIAALIPIVEGAGGCFTDIYANSWQSEKGITSALATNSAVQIDAVVYDI